MLASFLSLFQMSVVSPRSPQLLPHPSRRGRAGCGALLENPAERGIEDQRNEAFVNSPNTFPKCLKATGECCIIVFLTAEPDADSQAKALKSTVEIAPGHDLREIYMSCQLNVPLSRLWHRQSNANP